MTKEQLSAVIGHNIRRLRRAEGFTQAELAEMVDRDASTVTNIEGGKRLIGVDLLYRLAEVFSVSVDTLLQPKEKSTPLASINSMLTGQSDAALAHLEPIIRTWLSEYGDPKPPAKIGRASCRERV